MQKPYNILLIEDDQDDIELLSEVLNIRKVFYKMEVVSAGDKVSSYIQQCEIKPDIIVLDFNLPKLHGKEVLRRIKSSGKFKDVPLMVLTTSRALEDIEYSYRMGADSFITKPTTTAGFNHTIETILKLASRNEAEKSKCLQAELNRGHEIFYYY
jgi:DNA-binding response OmpR family regulator